MKKIIDFPYQIITASPVGTFRGIPIIIILLWIHDCESIEQGKLEMREDTGASFGVCLAVITTVNKILLSPSSMNLKGWHWDMVGRMHGQISGKVNSRSGR
jgi:hypothetical protein